MLGSEDLATITWGDGSTTAGTVTRSGPFSVTGRHTYAAAGTTFTVTKKTTFTHVVATFTDSDPGGMASDYSATIDWGDGTTSVGTIAAITLGGFEVSGTHSYRKKGIKTITVTITDAGGSTAMARSIFKVVNKEDNDEEDDNDDGDINNKPGGRLD